MKAEGPKPSVFKGPKVLACTECSFECDITASRELNAHTLGSHSRRPTLDEKTPVVSIPTTVG